jgi:hypothetical protein
VISAQLKTTGNTKWIKQARNRLKGTAPNRAIANWEAWVRNKRIPRMYKDEGAVRGEQGRWAPLSPWTAEVKGGSTTRGRMISRRGYQPGTMVRSYVIETKRRGLIAWESTISNRARASTGFDYPSALHDGWGPYTVPKGGAKKGVKLAWKTAAGNWNVYGETHPQGAPARPHLRFFGKDARKFMQTMARWVLRGDPRVPRGG